MPLKKRNFKSSGNTKWPRNLKKQKQMPRSYGRVLTAIRCGLGLTQPEIYDEVCKMDAEVPLACQQQNSWDYRSFVSTKSKEKFESAEIAERETRSKAHDYIRDLEYSNAKIPFGFDVRYARLANCRNGVLHLASAYYSDARNFCDTSKSEQEKDRALDNLDRAIIGLAGLTSKLAEFVHELRSDEEIVELLKNKDAKPIEKINEEHHYNFILDLLEAYSRQDIQPEDSVKHKKSKDSESAKDSA